ncbi:MULTISPECIES: TonB-dependent receptor [unclassified Lentimicrobium]|uniref:SusC/RagA family TonB-linked outer membrane protein n=1 Tax=unclassified Lentimicrobium TaxID=2677434 RepID=UPI0015550EF3|nr:MULTISPECIES: TonB-dependent receptor [unclassified Lentimicrobium]NPD47310.1 TonB-dependent receptor [Lentimicrobium sp. S6]NPD84693.1 TonB-dependent receptor [Lentimicrobium sp. L6]
MKSDVYNFLGLNTFAKRAMLLLGMLLLSVSFTLTAQNVYNYNGMVQDENGEPLPGVNVIEKGTSNGTISDIDGTFNMQSTQETVTVSFSMIGYITLDQSLIAGQKAVVVMKENVETLGEVLVVGYGTQKKANITGAVAKIDGKTLQEIPTTTVAGGLQGRLAGVAVSPSSGSPGAGQKVVIRGVATNGDAQPIYVVDGMVSGNIDNLEPNDIENITVLKDAASAAIYGANAANGVVLVTTKKGEKGAGRVSYSMQVGSQSVGDYTKPMDAQSYATWLDEANGTEVRSTGYNTNWMDETLQTAMMQKHHLSFSGGSDKGNYYSSISYLNQDGVVGGDNANFERLNARVNINQQIKKWMKVGVSANYTRFKRTSVSEDDEFGGVVASALSFDPTTPVIYENAIGDNLTAAYLNDIYMPAVNGGLAVTNDDGKYYGVSEIVAGEIVNPLAQIQSTKGYTKQDKLMGNMYMTLGDDTWKGFKFTTRASIDVANELYSYWTPTYWYSSERNNSGTNSNKNYNTWSTWMWENYISYDKTFAEKHNLAAVVGMSSQEYTHIWNNSTSSPMAAEGDAFNEHGDAQRPGDVAGNSQVERQVSYFARVSYDYEGKYLLQAIFRQDGTSMLHPDQKWGSYPSVSAGWIASNEDFWNVSFIDFFKVRASWGRNGMLNELRPDQYRSLITFSGLQYPDATGGWYAGAEPELLANPELTWASSEQLDIGFDMYMLGDKLTIGFDYFNKKTKDLLTIGSPPLSVGNTPSTVNAGDVTNKGVEIELGYRNYDNEFKYGISANMTFMKNEVTYLNPLLDRLDGTGLGTGWTATAFELGQPVWFFRGYETNGIFQNQAQVDAYKEANGGLAGYDPVPGDPIVVNVNGDNLINEEDQTNIGNPHPTFTWGASIDLAYKGFDFRTILQGVHGHDVLLGWNRYDRTTYNKPQFFFDDRWTGEGSTNEFPRAEQTSSYVYNSDLMVFKGSYVRIRQIQLGYTVPRSFMKDKVQNLRLYVSLDDYFTFSNYPGMDPAAGTSRNDAQGIDRGYYPTPRKIYFGLSFSF